LAVYDVAGREVAVLASGMRSGGSHAMQWNGRDRRDAEVPSGVYFLRLEFQGAVETQKIVIAR
jgi:flagellar hook assembly protein FlgD